MTQTMGPAEFDAAELGLMQELAKCEAELDQVIAAAHRQAGDTRSYSGWGRNRVVSWQLTDDEAIQRSGAAERVANASYRISSFRTHIDDMEAVYRAAPWTRWYPCLNADGHIHSDDRACPTLHRNSQQTLMGWETRLSGQPVEVVIADLGPRLCSVCFPGAPAEHCQSLSDITRADRDAARAAKNAARDAALAVKNLTGPFITHDGDRITTVAALKAVVRKPAETVVEIEYYKTSEDASEAYKDMPERLAEYIARAEARLEGEKADMNRACEILAAREAAAPGSGWSQADIDKAVAAAVKRTRKAYFG
jgi:hypothetical protein